MQEGDLSGWSHVPTRAKPGARNQQKISPGPADEQTEPAAAATKARRKKEKKTRKQQEAAGGSDLRVEPDDGEAALERGKSSESKQPAGGPEPAPVWQRKKEGHQPHEKREQEKQRKPRQGAQQGQQGAKHKQQQGPPKVKRRRYAFAGGTVIGAVLAFACMLGLQQATKVGLFLFRCRSRTSLRHS